ncbi:unnamed protein product [Rotaria magnacalcarata]|uniref:Reverse transcriptase domain-containing protein n=1 Tax=Rotaria magnacalcarata TaxID=392030 RepID=A0A819U3W0_9BILA|nr:unnamed protein product [Rotaria magnacalcarata]CAF1524863.1 unnamed protein product [Rotaria magnacalcarata]CAF1982782.1 unnamed protein product [Rotaria magnacalcarata]CAF2104414.1 unnamed protein product [Rotaria magnacalcarata]CAF2110382.1 unnamed protein product [Rotaria magnacalcarata]
MHNILRLEKYAHEQLKQRRHSAIIFFDIKVAFDSVWFDGIICKVRDLRLPQYLIRFVISFLDHRTAAIELQNALSKSFNLKSGTPQDSRLPPLLYIIYTTDSSNAIQKHTDTEYDLFVDNTTLWSSSNRITNLKDRLQTLVNDFQNWCKVWKLEIQQSKRN